MTCIGFKMIGSVESAGLAGPDSICGISLPHHRASQLSQELGKTALPLSLLYALVWVAQHLIRLSKLLKFFLGVGISRVLVRMHLWHKSNINLVPACCVISQFLQNHVMTDQGRDFCRLQGQHSSDELLTCMHKLALIQEAYLPGLFVVGLHIQLSSTTIIACSILT